MDAIAEKLDAKLRQWRPGVSYEVRALVSEIIDWADADASDIMHTRAIEQEVLNTLDEPTSR